MLSKIRTKIKALLTDEEKESIKQAASVVKNVATRNARTAKRNGKIAIRNARLELGMRILGKEELRKLSD